ncbi:MAG: hypothetical protein Q9213_002649 [Squamulea squamosa]
MSSSVHSRENNRDDAAASATVASLEAVVIEGGSSTDPAQPANGDELDTSLEPDTTLETLERHRKVLNRLKDVARWEEERHESLSKYLARALGLSRRPPIPEDEELSAMFDYYLPPETKLVVTVGDFDSSGTVRQRRHCVDLVGLKKSVKADCTTKKLGFHTFDFDLLTVRDQETVWDELDACKLLQKKARGTGRLQGKESITLVQDHVKCMEEISLHIKVVEDKKKSLLNLRNNFPSLDGTDTGVIPNPDEKYDNPIKANFNNFADRFDETLEKLNKQHSGLTATLDEAKSSLDVYFQVKTIEQNERGLIAESNNQAILVFTVVTVIFLPLSFFTSYFGMNLKGIADTDKEESYFWKVCVTAEVITLPEAGVPASVALIITPVPVIAILVKEEEVTEAKIELAP